MGEQRFSTAIFGSLSTRWRTGVLILAAGAIALTLISDAPVSRCFAACVSIGAISAFMYRLARVNGGGVFLWSLSALLMIAALSAPLGDNANEVRRTCGLVAAILLIASAAAFFAAAAKVSTRRVWNCAACDLALFTLMAWVAGNAAIDRRLQQVQSIQETTDTLIALYKLGADVTSIRERTGKLPKDEQELVAIRGEPMPKYAASVRMRYHCIGDDRYRLECAPLHFWSYQWDMFGWIVRYYGPTGPRRMRVVLF